LSNHVIDCSADEIALDRVQSCAWLCVCVCDSTAAHPGEPQLTTAVASRHWHESTARADFAHIPCREIWTI